jgi:hypothetical protein
MVSISIIKITIGKLIIKYYTKELQQPFPSLNKPFPGLLIIETAQGPSWKLLLPCWWLSFCRAALEPYVSFSSNMVRITKVKIIHIHK